MSLRLRLTLFFAAAALTIWTIAGAIAYLQARHSLNEMFDTQQMLFAKSLAGADFDTLLPDDPQQLSKTKKMIRHGDRGAEDDDVLAFAIFDSSGTMRLNDGENGRDFPYMPGTLGFIERTLLNDDDPWRLLYIDSSDNRFKIVVGQELEYRQDLAMQLLVGQLLPWLIALPFLMLTIVWLLTRELAPLRTVASELTARRPDDATTITPERVPLETRPLVHALNSLFKRTTDMLNHERRFTADAAHELRTPLTALRVQAEVAQMTDDDPAARHHALGQLTTGIDRATRLIEQLLALARLDPLTGPAESTAIDWLTLASKALNDAQPLADQRGTTLTLDAQSTPPALTGSPILLALLLRNLLDNALRYTPAGGRVTLILNAQGISVEDNGPGVDPAQLSHLTDRFFRPPGQSQPGSGLGLSIAERIASLHQWKLSLENRSVGGFAVHLRP